MVPTPMQGTASINYIVNGLCEQFQIMLRVLLMNGRVFLRALFLIEGHEQNDEIFLEFETLRLPKMKFLRRPVLFYAPMLKQQYIQQIVIICILTLY